MQQQSGHTIKAFDEDIERLRGLIGEMGQLAHQAIREAMRCLVERDTEGALSVVERDKQIDALEVETEKRVVQLIALRAPMAGDLRDAVAALKISGVVERIGDYAKNIARRVPLLNGASDIEPLSLLPEMARIATSMQRPCVRPIPPATWSPTSYALSSSGTPTRPCESSSATRRSTTSTIPSSARCSRT